MNFRKTLRSECASSTGRDRSSASFSMAGMNPGGFRWRGTVRGFKFVFLLFILPVSILCSKKNATNPEVATVEDLLIKDNEISGWRMAGEGWVVYNETDLRKVIDGDADKYVPYGFIEGAYQSYSGRIFQDTVTVFVYIFDQGKPSNSKELFNNLISSGSVFSAPQRWPTDTFPDAVVDRSQISQIIASYKSKYYISLNITSGTDESLAVLKTFALNIGTKIK
jgi:hypothetical protein